MKHMPELNPTQRQAARANDGPVLIVAGPGTGKTKTLTERIVYILGQGTPAGHILALTFTNKAAREMRERLSKLLGATNNLPKVTTFHALGYELLSQTGAITLIKEAERNQLIRELPRPAALKGVSIRELGHMISQAKTTPEQKKLTEPVRKLLAAYEQTLAEHKLHDFDDLLSKTYQLLTDHPDQQPQYTYLLVDEFQDTSELQYALLRQLNTTDNLFVIGDPNQSIYGFRGAGAEMFGRFRHDFPHAPEITLTTNYRSAPEIVHLGNAIFPDAPPLQPHLAQPGQVQAVQVLNEYSEAGWIINGIEREIGGSTMLRGSQHHAAEGGAESFRDFAVLYRTHATSRTVKRLLDESGMPFQVAGEGSPYERPDVKTILDTLAYCADGADLPAVKGLSASKLKTLLEPLKTTTATTSQLAATIVKKLQLEPSSDLQQFLNGLHRFDHQSIPAYLEHIRTIADQDFYDPTADAITLLTIHAAKGLEFKHLFLIGAEEDLLPHKRPHTEPNIDEERRLFYVAVTRAQTRLDILHTKKRSSQPATLSRFITPIPQHLLPRIIDPDIANQTRRLQKRAQKRSQTTLF